MLSKEETIIEIRDERQLRAVAGVSESQLEGIVKEFEQVEKEQKKQTEGKEGERMRRAGGGRHGILRTAKQKVLFILVYLKIYPTYDDLGSRFGMSRTAAFHNVSVYLPLVEKALSRLGVLPHRSFKNAEEFREVFSEMEEIIIDVTERRQVRPKDPEKQKESYSGKKKMHTVKNTIIANAMKFVLYVGQTFTGHNHDYRIFKEEFSTEEAWFENLQVLVDLGYQGIVKDYEGENIQIPLKIRRNQKITLIRH